MSAPDKHKANVRLALTLAAVAVLFVAVYVARIAIFGT